MKKLFLIALSVLFFSCGDSTTTESQNNTETTNTTETKKVNKTSKDCLTKYIKKPLTLLSQDIIEKNIDTQQAKIKSWEMSGRLGYKWKLNGKKIKIQLAIREIDDYVSGNTPSEKFFFMYHSPTEEEKAATQKALEKAGEENGNKEAMETISTMVDNNPFDYEKVSGIGDAAVWQHSASTVGEKVMHGYSLIVLLGNVTMTIQAELKNGRELNKEKTEAIAKDIVAKACK